MAISQHTSSIPAHSRKYDVNANLYPAIQRCIELLESRQLLSSSLFADQTTLNTGLTAQYGSFTGDLSADLTNDGKLDLLIEQASGINVLLGNGDGTFQTPKPIPTLAGSISGMALGDFNGDKIPDLAVSTYNDITGTGSIFILDGNGDGTFHLAQTVSSGQYPVSLCVADLNGDGRLDFVYENGGDVEVILQNTDGTFAAPVIYLAGNDATGVTVGDVNGDGHPDIVATSTNDYAEDAINVLIGNGDGTFKPVVAYQPDAIGAIEVELADLNGDNHPDIVELNDGQSTANSIHGDVDVFLNNGDGTFANAVGYGPQPDDFALADINGDGKLDLLTSTGGELSVSLGNGDGTFQSPLQYSAGPVADAVGGIVAGDFNGDGHADVLFVSRDCSTLTELLGTGQIIQQTLDGGLSVAGSLQPKTGETVPSIVNLKPQYPDSPAITGTVTFSLDGNVLSTVAVTDNSDGSATANFTYPALTAGDHTLTGTYSGDTNYVGDMMSSEVVTVSGGSGGDTLTGGAGTPSFGNVVFPTTTVVAGQKVKDKVPVIVSSGSSPLKGPVLVELLADTTNTLDGNQILLATIPRYLNLKANKTSSFSFNSKPFPATVASGAYYLLAEVSSPNASSSVSASTQTIQVAAPFVAVTAAIPVATKPLTIALNKSGVITVVLTNTGNIDATSKLTITLSASTDGVSNSDGGLLITTPARTVKLKAGKPTKYQIHFKHTAAMSAGTYFPYVFVSFDGVTATAFGPQQFTLS